MSQLNALATAVVSNVVTPVSYSTSGPADQGSAFDTRDYEGVCVFTLAAACASGSLTVKVVNCATSGGTYTDVTGGAFTVLTTTGISYVALDVGKLARYVKVNTTVGSGTWVMGVTFTGTKKTI
jgi:hypothetical protein